MKRKTIEQYLIYGMFAVRDEVRPVAKQVVEKMHAMGITVAMFTGDNHVTAQAIARDLGIDQVKADLKPEDKVAAIKELKKEYGMVAMIGDGINDAPALAESSVGIAMGTAVTDAAIEAADVALMGILTVAIAVTVQEVAELIAVGNGLRVARKPKIWL